MGIFTGQPRSDRRGTVLARTVVAAAQVLLPIFALAIFGFHQLDSNSTRFSAVAGEAAMEMRLVGRLLADLDDADIAADTYLEGGTAVSLVAFDQVRPRIDSGFDVARALDERGERRVALTAFRRWTAIKDRIREAEALRRAGRPQPEELEPAHDRDLTAVESGVSRLLEFAQSEIVGEVARGRRERFRDLLLLGLQIGVGLLIAGLVMRRLARETVEPLTRLAAAADRLRGGDRTERVVVEGPVELARLGTTFNVMADALELQQDELWRRAYSDALTGLPNRVAFLEQLEATAGAQRSTTVLFLDLDDFKAVNDALGHAAGDELLVAVAHRISKAIGPAGTVARLGGDEFAVMVVEGEPGSANSAGACSDGETLAGRILAALAVPLTIAGVELVPFASLGIATGSGHTSELLRDADVAMYEAKRAGRHGHAVFEPGMQDTAARRLADTRDLRQALERDQFRVVYQPIVDLRTRRIRATEALVRWEHPERGLVGPAEFIPLAEQTGLIVGIGDWVLREACRQAAEWTVRHPGADRAMTVNLSTRQLLEPELVDQVRSALREAGLPAQQLILEITETAVMADPETAVARLSALADLGVRLAIDDFGTGHSSLAYLRNLPVHSLKIAREFVSGMEHGADDLALVRGILALGHSLGLRVIAEGIESAAQHESLRDMGCDLAQGYLYARPMPAGGIGSMLAAAGSSVEVNADLDVAVRLGSDRRLPGAEGRLPRVAWNASALPRRPGP